MLDSCVFSAVRCRNPGIFILQFALLKPALQVLPTSPQALRIPLLWP